MGSGPEVLEPPVPWPDVPVLVLGAPGSGRRTWAEHLMRAHGAVPSMVWRMPDDASIDAANARFVGSDLFRVRTRVPRWASIRLDDSSRTAQNVLLKTLEELPGHARVIVRATPTDVLATIRSRCFVVDLVPGSLAEQQGLLEDAGMDPDEAAVLVEARPGRPGQAMRLAEILPARTRAHDLLSAAEARDPRAVATSLRDFEPGTDVWLGEWVRSALAGRPESHHNLAKAARPVLESVNRTLVGVGNPRLAVRLGLTTIINRPGE